MFGSDKVAIYGVGFYLTPRVIVKLPIYGENCATWGKKFEWRASNLNSQISTMLVHSDERIHSMSLHMRSG